MRAPQVGARAEAEALGEFCARWAFEQPSATLPEPVPEPERVPEER